MARVQTIMTPETLPFAHFFIAEPVPDFFHVPFCRPLMPHGVIGSVCSGLLATQPLSVPRILQKPIVHVEMRTASWAPSDRKTTTIFAGPRAWLIGLCFGQMCVILDALNCLFWSSDNTRLTHDCGEMSGATPFISKILSISLFCFFLPCYILSKWDISVKDSCLVHHAAGLYPSSIHRRPVK